MIECSSQEHCPRGRWFHDTCVGVNSADVEDDWRCSDQCSNMGISIYCCKIHIPDAEWVHCSQGDDCIKGGKFHVQCTGLKEIPVVWYCCRCCEVGQPNKEDHVQQYSMAMAWKGLLHLVEKDAERENDGEMMINLWTFNMPQFWKYNHYKYLILGHRLLASMHGWVPRRIREELKWNSTANLQGGPGTNIALDLLNEFLNNEFKVNLKHLHGQYSDSAIERCRKMAGSLGKALDDTIQCQVIDKFAGTSKSTRASYKTDMTKFIKLYSPKCMFDYIPGRKHKSFSSYDPKL